MVFAHLAPERSGQGIVLPCRHQIRTLDDLLMEARWLWAAETKDGVPRDPDEVPPLELSRTWGRVAIVLRPGAKISGEILARWRDQFSGYGDHSLLVNGDGILEVDWPNSSDVSRFDILLATTNQPTDVDPSAQSIADAWNDRPDFRNYFEENQKAHIFTFQDSEIKRHLR
jgi:hypothetical protein